MLHKFNIQKVVIFSVFLGLAVLVNPSQALASWPGRHHSDYHGRYDRHHGHDHYYRRHSHGGGIVISFPHIRVSLPVGCRRVFIDGRDYYTYNGVYYQQVSQGYQIVEPPVVVRTQQNFGPDSFTVNIPSSNGAYTAVTLKRSGSGYVGPQGEFYKEFPSVEQLRVMYAK